MPYDDLRKSRFSQPGQAYMVTTTTAARTPYFSDFPIARLAILELKRLYDEKRVEPLAWVLMPDHLHWLFQLQDGESLSKVVKDFKARSARRINLALERQGAFWQREYYDHALRKEEDVRKLARYIVANPVRKGIVDEISDYSFWDAIWLW